MYCTKPQAKGVYCVREDGHFGLCRLANKPSRWRAWWDKVGDALFT